MLSKNDSPIYKWPNEPSSASHVSNMLLSRPDPIVIERESNHRDRTICRNFEDKIIFSVFFH